MTSTTNNTLSGYEAIEYAERNGLTLSKYNDPTEEAREGLSVDEARKIAQEDPSLIYAEANMYTAMLEGGECGKKEITAPDAQAALVLAMEWAREGDWRVAGSVSVEVRNVSDEDDAAYGTLEVE